MKIKTITNFQAAHYEKEPPRFLTTSMCVCLHPHHIKLAISHGPLSPTHCFSLKRKVNGVRS
jgi:hypothetical protein